MRKLSKLLLLLLLAGCLAGCGGPEEISINSYVDVEFEGYDTLGFISEYEFDAKQMLRDYEDNLEDVSKKDLEKLLQEAIEFGKTSELANGDEIEVTWNIDEDDLAEFEEENKVKLIFSDFTIVVEDLEELETFDPFEKISVEFSGYAPYANASLKKSLESGDVGYRDFTYQMDKYSNLSNGDVVTVTVSNSAADFTQHCIETYGMIPGALTKEFVVSGCAEYVTDAEEIPAEAMTAISEHIQSILAEKTTGWVFPESFCGMTFMGNVFATAKEGSYAGDENVLYFLYKVDIDSVRDGAFSYYYYGSIENLMFDENGTLVYDLADVVVPKSSSGWFTSGTYFEYCNLIYDGYLTYDELYADKLQPLLEQYTVTDTVDKEIITKVTHEPKDYSVITADVKLGADCFTYKWYQGSYYVSGLTEKGYQELTKYSGSDYVSLKLPTATEDGSVVEGMYSSSAEGGYSFSSLAAAKVPCIELVCPDTYVSFYGFCEDNKFDSSYAFKLKNIVLNEGLTTLASGAFKNCAGLESIVLPETLEEIPEQAFYGCSNLQKVTIPATVTVIGQKAFVNCSILVIDTLEIGAMKIGAQAFSGVTLNKVTLSSDSYVPERYTSWSGVYAPWDGAVVKSLVIADGLTKVPDYAFELMDGVEEVVIPASVTEIGTRAFAGCDGLMAVTLPEGLEKIGEEAFCDCTALKSVEIPSTVTEIVRYAFKGCSSLSLDNLEISTLKIGAQAFNGVAIQEVTMSSDGYVSGRYLDWYIYTPWDGAFVKKITIAEGVTKIPDYAFEYCSGMTEVVIPASVKEIGINAFTASSTLKTVTLPEGLEIIGAEAFKECTALKSVNIPATVKNIGANAFYGCSSLAVDTLDISGMTIGDKAFYQATITELVLDSNEFTASCYMSWGTLYSPWKDTIVKKITVTENVTELPACVFGAVSSVNEVVLPSTVEKIGEKAFAYCYDLKKVYIPASVKEIGQDAFMEASEVTILAPAGSAAEKYAADNGIAFSESN